VTLAAGATAVLAAPPAFIPSPPQGVWNLGPLPVRAYAMAILLGIVVAVVVGGRRWEARGGVRNEVADVAIWAVPFGIVGGRLYHVLTDWDTYFGPGGRGFAASLRIWDGGLGIWGAVALGAVGAWIGARRHGILLPPFADAIAPGILLAQAIGRWGNYFNQELFGAPTTVPWALEIDRAHRPAGYEQYATFHPTFLYESLWCLAVAAFVVWADRRFRMGHGRVFALYVMLYCVGRTWWESLRIDDAPRHLMGLRFNVWVSVVVGLGALVYLVVSARLRPGRETELYREAHAAPAAGATEGTTEADADADPAEHPETHPSSGDALGDDVPPDAPAGPAPTL
jgi:prolipoprotein diacylglyceryl transferase